MNQTSFEFSMQVSGGRALLGAVRDLAAQVASYAGGKAVAAAVADEVVTAAEAAIAASRGDGTPIDVRFKRTPACLEVFVAGGQATALSATHLSRGPGLSVDWSVVGGRQVCHIRQGMA
ncbi:MAG TPA: hypothetical protein VMW48_16525 [Vicinamibacterales bacterium]|nr:hypothetical protein [Vicinamibacterales bacterium]